MKKNLLIVGGTSGFMIASIKSFLENASDYQDRVILLVDFILKWIQEKFDLEIDIDLIENSLRDLPFLNWASDLLGHTAHFFESLFIILIIFPDLRDFSLSSNAQK